MFYVYNPKDRIIKIESSGKVEVEESLYCGDELNQVALLFFMVKAGKLTVQQAFDKYLYEKSNG